MNALKQVARETLAAMDDGFYVAPSGQRVDIAEAQAAAVAGTRLFGPDELAEHHATERRERATVPIRFAVTPERTQEAARRLVVDEGVTDLVILNFASARNVGGGFLTGARAQEEDVTRCSGLYRCLETQPRYYAANRRERSLLYTDHIIYSPGVPWFRVEHSVFLERAFLASVITAPAPNAGEFLRQEPGQEARVHATLLRRAGYVLTVAQVTGHRALLLGAWGCGVFRNRPEAVADAFLSHLKSERFAGCFDRVEFAVFDPSANQPNLSAFRECVEAATSP